MVLDGEHELSGKIYRDLQLRNIERKRIDRWTISMHFGLAG